MRCAVLEIETYRYYGFTVADANARKHRTPREIEERKARDPLGLWRKRLMEENLLDEASADEIDLAAKDEAAAAAAFAEAGGAPAVEDIVRDVYWESDHDTPASRTGRHFFDS